MLKIALLGKAMRVVRNWPLYLMEWAGLVRQPRIVLKTRDNVRVEIRSNTNDRSMFNHTWIKDAYTPPGFEIGDEDIVFDVGAHAGFFTAFAAAKAKKGTVYAFEPEPENLELLERNVELNSFSNVVPVRDALAGTTGEKNLALFSGSTGGHAFEFLHEGNVDITIGTMTVPTVSLADFVASHKIARIDLFKMNCEGAEYEILFTCPESVLSIIRRISMQCHPIDEDRNEKTLKEFLERKGFQVTTKTEGTMLYAKR